jgi:hypothetical protein
MTRGVWLMRLGFILLLAAASAWVATHRQLLDVHTIEPTLRALGITRSIPA